MRYRYIRVFLDDGTVYRSKRHPTKEVPDQKWSEGITGAYDCIGEEGPFRVDLDNGGTLVTTNQRIHHLEFQEEVEIETGPLPSDRRAEAAR